MSYFADLTPYTYSLRTLGSEDARNIGWLSGSIAFTKGPVPDEALSILFELCKNPARQTRGYHVCELCPLDVSNDRMTEVEREGVRLKLGSAEIRVPGNAGIQFASPTLIYHYIKDHDYQPPPEFIGAVLRMKNTRGQNLME